VISEEWQDDRFPGHHYPSIFERNGKRKLIPGISEMLPFAYDDQSWLPAGTDMRRAVAIPRSPAAFELLDSLWERNAIFALPVRRVLGFYDVS
jgi:hypothetical protein